MMNIKYYLRGLGIGVIVTALIMGISSGKARHTLSDEEIKERARALGMTEKSEVLAEAVGEKQDGPAAGKTEGGEEASPAPALPSPTLAPEAEPSASPKQEEELTDPVEAALPEEEENFLPEPEEEDLSEPDPEETDEEQESGQTPSEETVTIQVESGEGSFLVCQKLEDAGLIPLASEFDRYLYEMGYDKRINIGTYEIPIGAAPEEIAKIIAKVK